MFILLYAITHTNRLMRDLLVSKIIQVCLSILYCILVVGKSSDHSGIIFCNLLWSCLFACVWATWKLRFMWIILYAITHRASVFSSGDPSGRVERFTVRYICRYHPGSEWWQQRRAPPRARICLDLWWIYYHLLMPCIWPTMQRLTREVKWSDLTWCDVMECCED